MKVYAATGHRPDKLGGYGSKGVIPNRVLLKIAREYLQKEQPDKTISGMALGWDMIWAFASIRENIPFIAAIPFEGQEHRWPEGNQRIYRDLRAKAAEVVIISEGGYHPIKMHKRNQWMVDHCDKLIALWNGSTGGTGSCVKYAQSKGRIIENLWENFECDMKTYPIM